MSHFSSAATIMMNITKKITLSFTLHATLFIKALFFN